MNRHNNLKSQKVCVIGLGYIGLPTAALLASKGYEVCGVDIQEEIVNTINKGEIHIVEPDLDTLVKKVVKNGKLRAKITPEESDIFIITVPTPFKIKKDSNNNKDFIPDISYVISAVNSIAPYLKEENIIILESTSPVGTTKKIEQILREKRPDLFEESESGTIKEKVYIAYCPERVLPGRILQELTENDRIVGGLTQEASKKVAEFYKTFVRGEVLITNAKTAELCKLTENAFRDVNIAFANELSMICDKFGIDVWELRELANRHPRVNILYPGVGVGGHCIAVDPWFIVSDAKEEARLIKTAREVNTYKTKWVTEKIKNEVLRFKLRNNKEPKVALMGLAFKPNIDDLRESPALYVAKQLTDELENIVCVEPNIPLNSKIKTENSKLLELVSVEDVVNSDIIVFLVAHREFKKLRVEDKVILDFCGIKFAN